MGGGGGGGGGGDIPMICPGAAAVSSTDCVVF